ncbi:MAG TPA: VapE domain-containing protein [Flavobacterium sp.]|nr:VapE domain-containing protein [Flavobacterium sp.]
MGKTFNRGEINQLKSVISKDVFKGRLPYAARETRLMRRANFVGSTNDSQFLNDETGSVRWLCFELTDKINFDYKKDIDIDRVWAQAYYMYHGGFKYELSAVEIEENERRNKKYTVRSVEQELIERFFYPPGIGNFREKIVVEQDIHFKTATDIKLILSKHAPGERTHEAKIGKALRALGFKIQSKRTEGYEYPRYGYYIVEKGS